MRTPDGDVFGAFHTREYEDAVRAVAKALRFFNTLKSCDTVSLSLVQLGVVSRKATAATTANNVEELARLFGIISRGGFLGECPSVAELADRASGETKVSRVPGMLYHVFALHLLTFSVCDDALVPSGSLLKDTTRSKPWSSIKLCVRCAQVL